MTLDKYRDIVDVLTNDRKKVSQGKRKDYTRGSEDVLANFKNQGEDLGIDPKVSLAVHMEKQFSAVMNYIKTNGESESEPIIKRIGDTINYLELLWGLINDLGNHGSMPEFDPKQPTLFDQEEETGEQGFPFNDSYFYNQPKEYYPATPDETTDGKSELRRAYELIAEERGLKETGMNVWEREDDPSRQYQLTPLGFQEVDIKKRHNNI